MIIIDLVCIVLFLFPRRPNLHRILVGHNWIYVSWNRNQAADNVSNYLVRYSYVGACNEISRREITQRLDSSNSSYNITDLAGAYLNYSITLIASNDTGSSPPNVASAVTQPTSMCFIISDYACSFFMKIIVYSSNRGSTNVYALVSILHEHHSTVAKCQM